jgi:hypothetical protein
MAAEQVQPRASALESQAITLLLLNPALTSELDPDKPPSMRDGAARALVDAWRAAVATEGSPDLERFVAGLDEASAELARSLLASARTRGARPDTASDREELRICLLRLRKEEVQDRLTDLQALISAGSRDPEQTDINDLERQFQVLHLEREQLEQEINPSAVMAGQRRK